MDTGRQKPSIADTLGNFSELELSKTGDHEANDVSDVLVDHQDGL